MKRIIKMDGVHNPEDPEDKLFAVWCTVSNTFEERDGAQAWQSAEELERAFDEEIVRSPTDVHRCWLEVLRDGCVSLARCSGY